MESVPAVDSSDCLSKCISYFDQTQIKCYYVTFITFPPDPEQTHPSICLLFQTCTKLETTSCQTCLSSSYAGAIKCDTPGICVVSTLVLNLAVC